VSNLHQMIARWARPGVVEWIGVRPARGVAMRSLDTAEVTEDGLSGDRSRPGKRAVTLIQAEHLHAIGSFLDVAPVLPEVLRRNIVVRGLNLAGLKGRAVQLGGAVLRLTVICAPCSQMERALGHGGYAAVRGHGGWCAEVLQPGVVSVGDAVTPRAETD